MLSHHSKVKVCKYQHRGFTLPCVQHRFLMTILCPQVDAALDLSHTQNIGRMIKTHFPYSQFIVVSLKEGMFSNANVIFRTKFVDGVSAVTRTVNAGRCVILRSTT